MAVGSTQTGQATPIGVVRNIHGRPEWEKISGLVDEWKPVGLVVGLPVRDDGLTQPMLPLSNAFAKRLQKKYLLPVYRSDERFSSIEASRVIAENRRRGRRRKTSREDTDKIAAALILEQWFSQEQQINGH